MKSNLLKAAIANYVSEMTRFFISGERYHLDTAKCAARWVQAAAEIEKNKSFRLTEQGYLDTPCFMNRRLAKHHGVEPFWFREDKLFEINVRNIKACIHEGDGIRLIAMYDTFPVNPGCFGTVSHVDDAGTIHMNWESGGSLGLVMEAGDLFEVQYAC